MLNFLTGTKVLEKTHSKYNGDIEVVKDFAFGKYIKVNGLTQSGGILKEIWQSTLLNLLKTKPKTKNCLILGLGGGSVAKLVSQYWVGAKITGVDIDKIMVDLGIKHLGLDTSKIKIVIQDASDYCQMASDSYDLILIDLYCGNQFPKKFEDKEFLKLVSKLLSINGTAIFNKLYGRDYKSDSMKFEQKLKEVFKKVDTFYPKSNVMFLCSGNTS